MTVTLQINDGPPGQWWLSPDIWTVPITPLGSPGSPIAGKPCYLWARVHNLGDETAINASVNFYWGNPAVGLTRNTATLVGTSAATVDPGGSADVLCLTPWMPVFVNGGHECVLAEAFLDGEDPLPSGPDFNVPTDRHVAQRNLSVLAAMASFHHAFEIHNDLRRRRHFRIRAANGTADQVRKLAERVDPKLKLPHEGAALKGIGFVLDSCPTPEQIKGAKETLDIDVGPFERRGCSLVGTAGNEPALVHVMQEADGRVVGGLSVLVVPAVKE